MHASGHEFDDEVCVQRPHIYRFNGEEFAGQNAVSLGGQEFRPACSASLSRPVLASRDLSDSRCGNHDAQFLGLADGRVRDAAPTALSAERETMPADYRQ